MKLYDTARHCTVLLVAITSVTAVNNALGKQIKFYKDSLNHMQAYILVTISIHDETKINNPLGKIHYLHNCNAIYH